MKQVSFIRIITADLPIMKPVKTQIDRGDNMKRMLSVLITCLLMFTLMPHQAMLQSHAFCTAAYSSGQKT